MKLENVIYCGDNLTRLKQLPDKYINLKYNDYEFKNKIKNKLFIFFYLFFFKEFYLFFLIFVIKLKRC